MKIFYIVLFIFIVASSACAQILPSSKKLLTDENAVSIEYQYVAKKDKVIKYLITPKDIKNPIPIPTGFRLLGNDLYQIETKLVDLGDSIYSFNLPKFSKDNFDKIRVLHLYPEPRSPSGFQWEDCTILPGKWQNDEMVSQERKDRLSRFLSDFSKNKISCISENKMESVEVFAVVSLDKPLPTEQVTDIKLALTEKPGSENKIIYELSVKNEGRKDVREVNFISIFDIDTKLISVNPGQGKCMNSEIGTSWGSTKCFLGQLAAGQVVNIEFTAEFLDNPMGSSNPNISPEQRIKNQNWLVSGFFKEKSEDIMLNQNRFCFEPFRNEGCK